MKTIGRLKAIGSNNLGSSATVLDPFRLRAFFYMTGRRPQRDAGRRPLGGGGEESSQPADFRACGIL